MKKPVFEFGAHPENIVAAERAVDYAEQGSFERATRALASARTALEYVENLDVWEAAKKYIEVRAR